MPATRSYSFGQYTLDLRRGALLRAGADVKLRPKSFEVLRLLIERHGQLVSREDLMNAVWGQVVVTDGVLAQSLIEVRRALGDASQNIVRTVPRRGYIFELPVVEEQQLNHTEYANGHLAVAAKQPAPPAVQAKQPAPPAAAGGQPAAGTTRSRIAPAAIIGAVLLLAGAGAAAWWLAKTRDPAGHAALPDYVLSLSPPADVASATRSSIAVLPFIDLSPEQNQEYFAEGMSEEILNLLAKSPELQVIARTSSFSFKGSKADIAEIAAKLNVAHVLEGSVRKDGSQLRITAQLIDASDSSHLWSETYDRELQDALAVQREIATHVAQALKVTLAEHGTASPATSTDPAAQESYLRGRFFFTRRAPGDLALAQQSYEEALRIDAKHARAWAGLAGVYGAQMAESGLPVERAVPLRLAALQKALESDPNLSEAHVRMARHQYFVGNEKLGDEHARRAYELDPDNPLVLDHLATRLAWHDRMDEAMALMKRAVMLDPVSSIAHGNFASYLAAAGRYPESRAERLAQIELSPTARPGAQADLLCLLILERRFEEARAMIPRLEPGDVRDKLSAMVAHALGDTASAQAALAKFAARPDASAALIVAEIYAQRDDREQTFHWMAVTRQRVGPDPWSSRNWSESWSLRFSPFLRRFHDDPRWERVSRVSPHETGG